MMRKLLLDTKRQWAKEVEDGTRADVMGEDALMERMR